MITLNDSLHRADGLVALSGFKAWPQYEATFDMSATLGRRVESATRKFAKDSPVSITIEGEIGLSEQTKPITWQMITTADMKIDEGVAVLRLDRKPLRLRNLSHSDLTLSMVSLYPAPLKLERQIEKLQRIELRFSAWKIEKGTTKIKVRLSGEHID